MFSIEFSEKLMQELGGHVGGPDTSSIQGLDEAIENGVYKEPWIKKAKKEKIELEKKATRTPEEDARLDAINGYIKKTEDIKAEGTESRKVELLQTNLQNLDDISNKLDKALEDGRLKSNRFTWGELNFIKCKPEIKHAVSAFTTGTLLKNNEELGNALDDVFTKIGEARVVYDQTVVLYGHVHGEGRHKEVKAFLDNMTISEAEYSKQTISSSLEIKESSEFQDQIENASAQELLALYREHRENEMKRSIVVYTLMEKHILPSGFDLQKNGKKYSLEAGETETEAQKISREELNEVLAVIETNDIDGFRMNKTLENLDYGLEKGLSVKKVAEAIMTDYKIKYQGGPAKYEDLIDPLRKNEVTLNIDKKIASEDKAGKEDLQYLLDLVDTKEKDFREDLLIMGNHRLISSDFIKDGDLAKLIAGPNNRKLEQIIEAIMTGNGGLNLLVVIFGAIYAMVKGKTKHVLIGAGVILGAQTLEENFVGSELQDDMVKFFKGVSPEMGDMVEGLIGATPFGKPKYEITFMNDEFEGIYKDLYTENAKKAADGKLSESMAEEDFAQIYAQLLENNEFRTASVGDISEALESPTFPSFTGADGKTINILGGVSIDSYKEGNLKTDDVELTKDRKLSNDKLKLVIKTLVEKRDRQGDVVGADLFASGVSEGLTVAGRKEFETENKALSDAYARVSPKNPRRERVEEVLDIANDWWKPENLAILVGIDGKREAQVDKMITALEVEKRGLSGDNLLEITAIIGALETLRDKSKSLEEVEKFVEGAFAGTDERLFGAEGIFKKGADVTAYGVVNSLHYFGFDKVPLPQTAEISSSDIQNRIIKGLELLDSLPDGEDGEKTEEQKKVKEAISILELYLIERRKIDSNDIAVGAARMQYMDHNSEAILNEFDGIEEEMKKLSNTNIDSLDGFYRAIMENIGNIKMLREYESVTGVFSPGTSLKVHEEATNLLAHLTVFINRLKDYNSENFWNGLDASGTPVRDTKFSDIVDSLKNADSDSISQVESDYNKLREELIDEDIMTSVKSGVKGTLDWFDAVDLSDVEKNKLVIIAELAGIDELKGFAKVNAEAMVTLGEDIEKKKKSFETTRRSNLENEMKALISRFNAEYITVARDSSGNITSPSNAGDFIDHIKDLKKKDEDNLMSSEIQKQIDTYMEHLANSVVVNDPEIKEKKRDFDKLKKEIGTYAFGKPYTDVLVPDTEAENAFEERYALVAVDTLRKEFMLRNATDPIIDEIYEKSGLADYLRTPNTIPYGSTRGMSINSRDLNVESLSGILRLLDRAIRYHSAGTLQDELTGYKEDIKKQMDIQIDGYIGRFFK